jgi:hypothetical protein
MAGRVAILPLYPMTLHERYQHVSEHWLPIVLEEPDLLPQRFPLIMPAQLSQLRDLSCYLNSLAIILVLSLI